MFPLIMVTTIFLNDLTPIPRTTHQLNNRLKFHFSNRGSPIKLVSVGIVVGISVGIFNVLWFNYIAFATLGCIHFECLLLNATEHFI